MDRPRLLLVSGVCELEWQIKPELESWADVISLEPPGVGESPGEWGIDAAGERALELADEAGWSDFVLATDGWGSWYLPGILAMRSEALAGLAVGHAALTNRMEGDRPVRNAAVWAVLAEMIGKGREQFAPFAITQFTSDGIDEPLADEMINRVPIPVFEAMIEEGGAAEYDLRESLKALDVPILLGQHKGCLLYTDEGYEDAVAEFPEARRCATEKMCSADPAYASALREFCEEIYA
jgi:hypothetical protein